MVSAPVWKFRPGTIIADFPDSNDEKTIGKPDAGKPHVRFDEGEQISEYCWFAFYSTGENTLKTANHEVHEDFISRHLHIAVNLPLFLLFQNIHPVSWCVAPVHEFSGVHRLVRR